MTRARFIFCFCLLLGCVRPTNAEEGKGAAANAVVEKQLAAFNRHDPDALADGVSEDFVWYSVTSDSTAIESKSREKLREGMKAYFKSFPDVSSKIEGVVAAGAFVSFRETASWTSKNGPRSQSSIGIYEVHDGLITRIWYYPAAR
ncbi:MAG TPA: nuclear transport factor 2 family protein [Candidatus Didemnitutus sp.]|nr:nuclear transport factor 2 family protein [Candidatus Didemnitutus sp.]